MEERKERISKTEYYLRIASMVAMRSTCLKVKFGAIIVDDDGVILSTGYNGSARGSFNCDDLNYCLQEHLGSRGFFDYCIAVHAEENAVINAARSGAKIKGATLYLAAAADSTPKQIERAYGWLNKGPCFRCRRILINAGIKEVVTPYKRWTFNDLVNLERKWFEDAYRKARERESKEAL